MDAGFDEDETELRVFVFTVSLEVLADGNRLYPLASLKCARIVFCQSDMIVSTFFINM